MKLFFNLTMIVLFASAMKKKLIELQDENLNQKDENFTQIIDENLNEIVNESRDVCPICYEDLLLDEALTKPLCGHYYHFDCLKEWLMRSTEEIPTCPKCKVQELRLMEIQRYIPERNTFRNVSALEEREYALQQNELNEAERRGAEAERRWRMIAKWIVRFIQMNNFFWFISGATCSIMIFLLGAITNSSLFVHHILLAIISLMEFFQTQMNSYVFMDEVRDNDLHDGHPANILTMKNVRMIFFSWIFSIVYFVLLNTYFSSSYHQNGEYN